MKKIKTLIKMRNIITLFIIYILVSGNSVLSIENINVVSENTVKQVTKEKSIQQSDITKEDDVEYIDYTNNMYFDYADMYGNDLLDTMMTEQIEVEEEIDELTTGNDITPPKTTELNAVFLMDKDKKEELEKEGLTQTYHGSVVKVEDNPLHNKKPLIELEGKLIKSVDLSLGYRGNLSFDFKTQDKLSAFYELPTTDISTKIKFADGKTVIVASFDPIPNESQPNYFSNGVGNLYIKRKLTDKQSITIGRCSRLPIGYESKLSPYNQYFINKAQISDKFGDVRSTGLRNEGNYKYVDYNVGVYNSTRKFATGIDGGDFVGWVNLKPLANVNNTKYGEVVLGTGVNLGQKDNNDYSVLGAYLGYKYKRFLANFECAKANGYNGSNFSNNEAYGFYTTIGYNLTDKLQLVTRYDFFDPDMNRGNDLSVEYSTGINYYLINQNFKLGLNYVIVDKENQPQSNRILFLTQIAF